MDAVGAVRGMSGLIAHGAPATAASVIDDVAKVGDVAVSRAADFAALRDADGMVKVRDASGRISNGMPSDPLWHQKTPIYQVYTRTFADGLGTGTGNLKGATERLDHLQYMRQKAVWISPHHPYGGKDQGYDIVDYFAVNPKFGTMKDFEHFVDEAHGRDIRVITEMVANHTSNQHKWFTDEKAKLADIVRTKGRGAAQEYAESTGKDGPMYVWDFTRTKEQGPPDKWKDVRVIFDDIEVEGNWAWSDDAQGYYWHRFFTEQPDLNWENPRAAEEMAGVLKFWLDKGVDGIRLDAVPYLHQGTRNAHGRVYHGENMRETHEQIKRIRAVMDEGYADRITVGEANMDAAATREYFGNGDESQALFDFPTMPQMYMGLLERDKTRILAALKQAQGIPEGTAWMRFLRNHDELTLEKVTPEEREWMWQMFREGDAARGITADPESKINLGLRIRLSDAVGHDNDLAMKQKAVEALNAIHYSVSGTPIMYQGDEIGMDAIRGKNLFDRERVRGTMQWDATKNHGFSSADNVTEPMADAVEGARIANVADQKADPNSLMNRTRNMLLARETSPTLQSGAHEVEVPTSAKELLAFQRSSDTERVVSMVNLSPNKTTSTLEVDVPDGWRVEHLHGSREFDVSKGIPSTVTMEPYEYQWIRLVKDDAAPAATGGATSAVAGAQQPLSSGAKLGVAGAMAGAAGIGGVAGWRSH
ncbi:MAG: treS [Thermoleophilia bacterium]|nr:treS [Thermoleophilia bacterium]